VNTPKPGVAIESKGLGQLTVDTAWQHCRMSAADLHDPEKNVLCSAKVLKYQLNRYRSKDNAVEWAVAAYNWGTPCACKSGVYTKSLRKSGELTEITCRKRGSLEPLTCSASEEGKFFNQDYVDKFQTYLTSN
jgi:hypothetical protein